MKRAWIAIGVRCAALGIGTVCGLLYLLLWWMIAGSVDAPEMPEIPVAHTAWCTKP